MYVPRIVVTRDLCFGKKKKKAVIHKLIIRINIMRHV